MRAWEIAVCFLGVLYLAILARVAAVPTVLDYAAAHGDRLLWAPESSLFAEAANGDVLLLASPRARLVAYATGSPFTHVALVFRDAAGAGGGSPQIAYLWDADLGQRHRAGPRVIRLADKLARFDGGRETVVGWKRLRTQRPATRAILHVAARYLAHGMDRLMVKWVLLRLLGVCLPTPGQLYCSELVAQTLQELGLFRAATPAAWYAPGDWHRDRLDLAPGVEYGPTRFVRLSVRGAAAAARVPGQARAPRGGAPRRP